MERPRGTWGDGKKLFAGRVKAGVGRFRGELSLGGSVLFTFAPRFLSSTQL